MAIFSLKLSAEKLKHLGKLQEYFTEAKQQHDDCVAAASDAEAAQVSSRRVLHLCEASLKQAEAELQKLQSVVEGAKKNLAALNKERLEVSNVQQRETEALLRQAIKSGNVLISEAEISFEVPDAFLALNAESNQSIANAQSEICQQTGIFSQMGMDVASQAASVETKREAVQKAQEAYNTAMRTFGEALQKKGESKRALEAVEGWLEELTILS
jgi:hypothetical protein